MHEPEAYGLFTQGVFSFFILACCNIFKTNIVHICKVLNFVTEILLLVCFFFFYSFSLSSKFLLRSGWNVGLVDFMDCLQCNLWLRKS